MSMTMYLGYPPEHQRRWIHEQLNGKAVFTYRVNVENGQLELDFGPEMAGKQVGVETEEV